MLDQRLYDVMTLLDAAEIGGGNVIEQVKNLLADYNRLLAQTEKTRKETDHDRMMRGLDQDRCEQLALLYDWCLDHALPDEARGWGWLWTHRRWPVRLHSGVWHWTTPLEDRTGLWSQGRITARDVAVLVMSHAEHCLPPSLHDAVYLPLMGRGGDSFGWPSAGEALWEVVSVIAAGKWSSGVAGPEPPRGFTSGRSQHAVISLEE